VRTPSPHLPSLHHSITIEAAVGNDRGETIDVHDVIDFRARRLWHALSYLDACPIAFIAATGLFARKPRGVR
jgi:hypothetical protein